MTTLLSPYYSIIPSSQCDLPEYSIIPPSLTSLNNLDQHEPKISKSNSLNAINTNFDQNSYAKTYNLIDDKYSKSIDQNYIEFSNSLNLSVKKYNEPFNRTSLPTKISDTSFLSDNNLNKNINLESFKSKISQNSQNFTVLSDHNLSNNDFNYTSSSYSPFKLPVQSCMELALQGEKLCMNGDCYNGIKYFEMAISVGTDDLTVLSAIYSQTGNAYYYLQDYSNALEFHRHDLNLAQKMDDFHKQATALGNLSNTLKCMEAFQEAIICGEKELFIGKELSNLIIQARAFYNLGNIYHSKGKKIMSEQVGISCLLSSSYLKDGVTCLDDLTKTFERAIYYYSENLILSEKLNDTAAQGRAFGQLGNINYRLGRWDTAIDLHGKRLKIAQFLKDNSGERRALANLANAHAGAGRINAALDYYMKALQLSKMMMEPEAEAQACWSLAAAYNLIDNYDMAIHYQKRHLDIAGVLKDKIGEHKGWVQLVPLYKKLGMNDDAEVAIKNAKNLSLELNLSSFLDKQSNTSSIEESTKYNYESMLNIDNIDMTQANHHSTGIFETDSKSINLSRPKTSTMKDEHTKSKSISQFLTTMKRSVTTSERENLLKLPKNKNSDGEKMQQFATLNKNYKLMPFSLKPKAHLDKFKLSKSKKFYKNGNILNKKLSKRQVTAEVLNIDRDGSGNKTLKDKNLKRPKQRDGNDLFQLLQEIQGSDTRIDDQRTNIDYTKKFQTVKKSSISKPLFDSNKDSIPNFLIKNSKLTEGNKLEGFLDSLASSACKRIDHQRISTEKLIPGIIREYIPPSDNTENNNLSDYTNLEAIHDRITSSNNRQNETAIDTIPVLPLGSHLSQRLSHSESNLSSITNTSSSSHIKQLTANNLNKMSKKDSKKIESVMDLVLNAQSKRLDQQRCDINDYKVDDSSFNTTKTEEKTEEKIERQSNSKINLLPKKVLRTVSDTVYSGKSKSSKNTKDEINSVPTFIPRPFNTPKVIRKKNSPSPNRFTKSDSKSVSGK